MLNSYYNVYKWLPLGLINVCCIYLWWSLFYLVIESRHTVRFRWKGDKGGGNISFVATKHLCKQLRQIQTYYSHIVPTIPFSDIYVSFCSTFFSSCHVHLFVFVRLIWTVRTSYQIVRILFFCFFLCCFCFTLFIFFLVPESLFFMETRLTVCWGWCQTCTVTQF